MPCRHIRIVAGSCRRLGRAVNGQAAAFFKRCACPAVKVVPAQQALLWDAEQTDRTFLLVDMDLCFAGQHWAWPQPTEHWEHGGPAGTQRLPADLVAALASSGDPVEHSCSSLGLKSGNCFGQPSAAARMCLPARLRILRPVVPHWSLPRSIIPWICTGWAYMPWECSSAATYGVHR